MCLLSALGTGLSTKCQGKSCSSRYGICNSSLACRLAAGLARAGRPDGHFGCPSASRHGPLLHPQAFPSHVTGTPPVPCRLPLLPLPLMPPVCQPKHSVCHAVRASHPVQLSPRLERLCVVLGVACGKQDTRRLAIEPADLQS